MPLKRIIFKSVEVVLFLEPELQRLFSTEYDSFIKVKLRNVVWFNTWVKLIVQMGGKTYGPLSQLHWNRRTSSPQLFSLIILNKLFNL